MLESFLNRGGAPNIPDFLQHQVRIGPVAQNERKPAPVVRARLSIDRDVIDVLERDASFAQAIVDRVRRQTCPVFDAAKTFLFGGRDEPAVLNQAGGGITVIRIEA